jgi:hypothetical protein
MLATSGRVLRAWNLGRGVVNARLNGRRLVVQRGTSALVFDARTGARIASLPLVRDEGAHVSLTDVEGDLVAYTTGGAIHLLRLSNGRDVVLRIPGAAPPLDARLEPSGLYLTWSQMDSLRPGRLAFVPLRVVERGV